MKERLQIALNLEFRSRAFAFVAKTVPLSRGVINAESRMFRALTLTETRNLG